MVLALIFLLFPMFKSWRNRITPLDWLCAAASVFVVGYIAWQGPEFGDRAIDPEPMDYAVGLVLIALLLEATRRSTGWIMPVVSLSLSPTRCSDTGCRRHGRIAATISNASPATST